MVTGTRRRYEICYTCTEKSKHKATNCLLIVFALVLFKELVWTLFPQSQEKTRVINDLEIP